ncbi:DUF1289 domain-containing protein [Vibrio sp. HN007]|uniref:DUF1289 domain-containing protein n=1 Tax=Vibrio iocasae TaxID=3098914 RepID=UPI0035D4F412
MFIGNNTSVITPCTGRCELDEGAICKGCFRSSSEIADWVNKSEDEKISIVIRCKKRIAKQNGA